MKRIILLAAVLAASLTSSAQCLGPTAAATLDINNVNALLLNGGDLWWDFNQGRYEVPFGSGKKPVFSGAFWVGGLDDNDELRLSAIQYRQVGNDYFSGPIQDGENTTQSFCDEWNRTWEISKADIDAFINGGSPTADMISWPAKGNPNAPTTVASYLAPFKDVNGDGIYNASDRDYPLIKGDQAIYWVFNDVGNIHSESQGAQLGFEFHAMAFAYIGSEHVNNATYYEYTIVNKGQNLHDLYFGHFTDIDLGNSTDDYVGVDTAMNMGFGYNGDAIDEGPSGYGSDLAMVGIQMDAPPYGEGMATFNYVTNDPGGPHGSPSQAPSFYELLKGNNTDGSQQQDLNGNPTTYAVNGIPGVSNEAMCAQAGLIPTDYKLIQGYGPHNMEVNDVVGLGFSVVFAQDSTFTSGPCSGYDAFRNAAMDVHSNYMNDQCINFNLSITDSIADATQGESNGSITLVSLGNEGSYNYLWSDGATERDRAGLAAGTYTLTITNAFGCSHEQSFTVNEDVTGLTETRLASLRLYPIPAHDILMIQPVQNNKIYTVLDITGRKMFSGICTNQISVEALPAGSYFLQLEGSETKISMKMD